MPPPKPPSTMAEMSADANTRKTNNDLPPSSSGAPKLDYFSLPDDLANGAVSANWPRPPDIRDLEKSAELTIAIGHSSAGYPLDMSAVGRGHSSNLFVESRGGYGSAPREILDAKISQQGTAQLSRGGYFP